MSLVKCAVVGCPERVREGLVRPWHEQQQRKADGRRCWRCRLGRTSHLAPAGAKEKRRG